MTAETSRIKRKEYSRLNKKKGDGVFDGKLKYCPRCNKHLPRTKEYWHKHSYTKNGLACYCKKCRNKNDIKNKYGITKEDYNKMFDDQNGRCAICGIHQSELKSRLCVDHNHKTDEVRDLLCNRCNTILGYCKENKLVLIKCVEYLR